MASTISAGTTTTTALVYTADTSGVLQLQTNGTTTAVTIDTSQNVGIGVTPSAIASYKVLAINNSTGGLIDLMVNGTSTGYLYTDSGGLKVEGVGATPILFKTNGTTALTVDTSQNVGIGVTPSAWGTLKAIEIAGGGSVSSYNQATQLNANCYYNGSSYVIKNNGSAAGYFQISANQFQWWQTSVTSGNFTATQAMTLDNSGQLLVNQTSSSLGATTYIQSSANLASQVCAAFKDTGTTYGSSSNYIYFLNSSGSVAGGIQHTASTVVVYNATSDERLKENIVDAPNALDKVLNIPVRSYDWKEDKQHVDYGFIAQELGKIYIEPVSVGGDNEKQNPWGVDYGRLTPLLVKAIQEQQAIIESLTQRILTLENK